TDATGTALDGEFTGTFPSGDGSAGGNFVFNFSMRPDSETYPFAPEPPVGSLIYDPVVRRVIAPAGDTDTFTVPVDPGQTISALVIPNTATLQPVIQLIDPNGVVVGMATASGPGESVLLQMIAATKAADGPYKVVVSDASPTATGYYKLQVLLNSALETPGDDLGTNKSRTTAQDLDATSIDLPTASGHASRGAVVGSVGSITLNAIDDGWWNTLGNHTASNENYIVGLSGST